MTTDWTTDIPLVLYHRSLASAPGAAMLAFRQALAAGAGAEGAYLDLVRSLYALDPVPGPTDDAWQNHLLHRVLLDENGFTTAAAAGRLTPQVEAAAAHDLRLLHQLFRLTGEEARAMVKRPDLPTWTGWTAPESHGFLSPDYRAMVARLAGAQDWGALVGELAAFHRRAGAGVVCRSWFLRWDGTALQPVEDPDLIEIDDLVGLAEQKAALLENTEPFVRGLSANNLLLYGPRGTGKSSLVRGLALRFGARGLRLVEVAREHLDSMTRLFRALKEHPQRFVVFLDDLAFDADDAPYRAFKSTLEGALERRPANVLLYATTNRRHMLPERWSDRNAPEVAEVHGQDALEEKLSLADRFGRTVLFLRPSQEEYLAIVERLAAQRNLPIGREELREAARRWVLWQNAPSGRAARQFIDDLAGRLAR